MQHFLVVDLEATCCDDGSLPDSERETIEIAAVLVSKNVAAFREFNCFVRPVKHPKLTEFCTKLTGIGQPTVDTAPLFPEAMRLANEWVRPLIGSQTCCFASWGKFDWNQLKTDCSYHNITFPWSDFSYVNIAGIPKPFIGRTNQRRLMKHFGMVWKGHRHSGIDDARNYARLMLVMLMKGWIA